MKFNARHDLNAALSEVFAELCKTARWERVAQRRGIAVQRQDTGAGLDVGATWAVSATLRGKLREGTISVIEKTPPTQLVFTAASSLFGAAITVDLTELAPRRTRVMVAVELSPNGLTARIMLQSMKLAKASLQKRFAGRVKQGLAEMGERMAPPGVV